MAGYHSLEAIAPGTAPSFAAASLLAAGPGGGEAGRSTPLGRLLWAAGARSLFFAWATPFSALDGKRHHSADLLPSVLDHVQALLAKEGGPGGASALAVEAARSQTTSLLAEVAADMRAGALRVFAWLLSHAFGWLFGDDIAVNLEAVARLRALAADGATLVLLPTHKSHVDYLMLSYVNFAAGLPCPHIAAGANLSLPGGVGRVLRSCGAFFIRRTSGGAPDASLYKKTLFSYVRALLREGCALEFFIEGGRSRDGRVNAPKLGLLAYVVEVACEAPPQEIVVVPVALSYDKVLEERALARQLAGEPKQKESLLGLAATLAGMLRSAVSSCWRNRLTGAVARGGSAGRASVRFGEAIRLEGFLRAQASQGQEANSVAGAAVASPPVCELLPEGSKARRHAIQVLGQKIVSDLRTLNVIATSALLAGSLLLQQQHQAAGAMSIMELQQGMEWLASQVALRGGDVIRPGTGAQLLHLINLLPEWLAADVASRSNTDEATVRVLPGWEAALCFHWRLNQMLPWFAAEALIACAAAAEGEEQPFTAANGMKSRPLGRETILESAAWLRRLLAPEMDTAIGHGVLRDGNAFEPALELMLDRGQLAALRGGGITQPTTGEGQRSSRFAAQLLAPLLSTYAAVARHVHAELSSHPTGLEAAALCDAAQAVLMVQGREGMHPCSMRGVVPSTALVQGAVTSLQQLGFLISRPAASLAGAGSPPPKLVPNGDLAGSDSDQGSVMDGSDELGPYAACASRGMPEAMASSVAAGLCRMAGPESSADPGTTQPLVLAPQFEGGKGLQALMARIEAYRP